MSGLVSPDTSPAAADTRQSGGGRVGAVEGRYSQIWLDGGPVGGLATYHHLDPVLVVPGLLPGRVAVYRLVGMVVRPVGFWSKTIRRFQWQGWTDSDS